MVEQYSLKLPKAVYSGLNALDQLVPIIKGKYYKAVIFTDKGIQGAGLLAPVLDRLEKCQVELEIIDDLPAEPDYHQVQKVVDQFKNMRADLIIAVGGGSVMDTAKLASVTAEGWYGIQQLLEEPLLGQKRVDTVMIPTTAGTGAEATPNAIVAVPEQEVKVGIVNPDMIADYVILDGEMIRDLPKKIGAATGIDALAHAVECYTSNKANPFSNLFALEALKLIFANLEKACMNPEAVEEKTNMLRAAFYAGIAITSSGTTAVHALSYPLGGKYHIAHGVANAILLLPVMRFNKPACLREFGEIYDALGEVKTAKTLEEKGDWVLNRMAQMIRNLEIPTTLTEWGVGMEDLEELTKSGLEVKRLLNNNKREITYEDARRLYLQIMEGGDKK